MTKPQFDELFSETYQTLLNRASYWLNKQEGPDLVHHVYCQIVTSESYREQGRGVKEGKLWLLCRIALQVKQQKRNRVRRQEDPLAPDDDDDNEDDF